MIEGTDGVGITYVNTLLTRGILNGVVNLSFGAYHFSTDKDGKTVDPDLRTVLRMRMDVVCAKNFHAALGSFLDSLDQQPTNAVPGGIAMPKDKILN